MSSLLFSILEHTVELLMTRRVSSISRPILDNLSVYVILGRQQTMQVSIAATLPRALPLGEEAIYR